MLKEGQVLNNTYRILRCIGEGGMGVVYEANHARLAGRYAVKVLRESLSTERQALAQFEREARTTSSLQHPNIVQITDFNRTPDGTEYLVMEYLQGQSLADRLFKAGPLPPPLVVAIVEQVAAALAAAHGHGVVHRDLKPDNVFLVPVEGRKDEQVKVLDFGISKVKDSDRGLQGPVSTLRGTPQYMAPEQCRGRTADVDAATDQFALAAITYEMLTGRLPFPGDNVGIVLSRVLYDDMPPMGLAPEIEDVVRRGLAKSNRDRFPSVLVFAESLRHAVTACFADEQPLIARIADSTKPSAFPRTGFDTSSEMWSGCEEEAAFATSKRRRRWGAVLFTVAAVGIVTLFVVLRTPGRWRWGYGSVDAISSAEGVSTHDKNIVVPAREITGENALSRGGTVESAKTTTVLPIPVSPTPVNPTPVLPALVDFHPSTDAQGMTPDSEPARQEPRRHTSPRLTDPQAIPDPSAPAENAATAIPDSSELNQSPTLEVPAPVAAPWPGPADEDATLPLNDRLIP